MAAAVFQKLTMKSSVFLLLLLLTAFTCGEEVEELQVETLVSGTRVTLQ